MKVIVAAIIIGIGWGGCGWSQVTNLEAPGNLKATNHIECISFEQAPPDLSPADIQIGVWDCYEKKDYETATKLVLLMFAKGVFDMRRVADKTAHQAISVLMMELTMQDPDGWELHMGPVISSYVKEGERKNTFCHTLLTLPTPTHDPSYMVQHGMRAFTGEQGEPLEAGFDPDATWREVLSGYMKCN